MSKYIDELTELICDTVRTVFPNVSLDDGYDVADDVIAKLPTIEVSEDCISRADLIESFLADSECKREEAKACMCSLDLMLELIEDAPSVVPSRAEGEWINKQEKYQIAECSNCKKVTMHEMWGDKLVYYDYCPNCGAKMKG